MANHVCVWLVSGAQCDALDSRMGGHRSALQPGAIKCVEMPGAPMISL